MYYKEHGPMAEDFQARASMKNFLRWEYRHFGHELLRSIQRFDDRDVSTGYDSVRVAYIGNQPVAFHLHGSADECHMVMTYHNQRDFLG